MATYTVYGNTVTHTVEGHTNSWRCKLVYTVTDYPTYVTIAVTNYFNMPSGSMYFVADRIKSYWYLDDWLYKSASAPSSNKTLNAGDYAPASYTTTRQKTTTAYSVDIYGKVVVHPYSSWNGTSTTAVQTVTIPALDSKTVSYDANGGSGAITSQTKYYGIDLTLSDGTGFTYTNHTQTGWNTASDGTGTDYELGGTFTDNPASNVDLYAMWHLDYTEPVVSNISVYRVASNGSTTETDDGTYLYIYFSYVGGSLDAGVTHIAPKIKIEIDGVQKQDAQQVNASGNYGTWYGTYSKDTAHTVVVTVYDANSNGVSFTRSISTATYPIDLVANGNDVYMGVMTPAISGQELTLHGHKVTGDVDIAGNYKINGTNLSASDVGALASSVVADYVTEKGTTDGWAYRKWSSGKVEAWNVYSFQSASWTTWASPIRYMDKTITIPNGIFTTTPNMMATSISNQYWIIDCNASSTTAGNMRIASVTSTSMATYANIYAWTD